MKTHPISMFRVNLTDYEEPVQVTIHGQVIGTWHPAGSAETRPELTFNSTASDNFTGAPVVTNAAVTYEPVATVDRLIPGRGNPTVTKPMVDWEGGGFGSSRAVPKPGKGK